MDEQKTEEVQSSPEGSGEGDKPETTNLIEDANSAAERLEKANTKREELLNRQEILIAKQTLGGKSDAGEESKAEETPKEYKDRIMRGEETAP